ncbi:MAG: NF038122 family metalloprotease [Phycisphaerales bacterium]|nr:NF038122 family metalloprotease [Phycisphaerales bacterium]
MWMSRAKGLVLGSVALLASIAGSASAQVAPALDVTNSTGYTLPGGSARLVIPGPTVLATLPGGGVVPLDTQTVWKPICSNRAVMTPDDLRAMVAAHNADFADDTKVIIVDRKTKGGGAPRAGLDVVFVLGPSVPAAAIPAFAAAEAYMESQFTTDAFTLTVPVSFAPLQSGVIGGTGSSYGTASWASSRSLLVGGMDGNDTIHTSLPSGSTIPVRYSVTSTTNETRIFWTFANWKANGGTVSGNDASMQYSTNFPFDMDPSNGVTVNTISLQDVIIHETGHAMGCTSGVDFRSKDIEAMDIFRFRRTDGSGSSDFNPDTPAEFGVRPRWAVRNNPNDDVNFDDIGAAEYRFSDGSPWQASHWREQVPAIGIMDPAFSYGETFYPNFYRTSDLTLFDAIGYDR